MSEPVHISEALPTEYNPAKLRETLDRPFPQSAIKTRRGNFGTELSYVEASEYIKRLNECFGVAWSFQIILHEVQDDECIVLGKLITHGHIRMAFGGSQITRNKETDATISMADDLKAAATDAFKKSCSFLGVGLHLYSDSNSAGYNGGNGNSRPGNGNGNGSGYSQGNGNNRLTSRQLAAIFAIGKDKGLNRDKLNSMSLERFSANLEFMSKHDASSLIQELTEM